MKNAYLCQQFIDIHTHDLNACGHTRILNLDAAKPLIGSTEYEYCSVGIHPWTLNGENSAEALERLKAMAHQPKVLAIGECGLDRLAATPWVLQEEALQQQIDLAILLGKPMIIHCVRAHNELIRIARAKKLALPLIIHGFDSSLAIAKQMLDYGFYLGFGKALLNPKSNAAKVILECPTDRVFVETDDSDYPIEAYYAKACELLQLGMDDFSAIIAQNFTRVFRL